MPESLVSCIIAVLNEEYLIRHIIDSIHMQDYRPLEAIIVDGGSKDATINIIKDKMAELNDANFTIKLYHEKDFGELRSPANARNIAIDSCKGVYVIFLDVDIYFIDSSTITSAIKEIDQTSRFILFKSKPLIDTELERQIACDKYGINSAICYRQYVLENIRFNPELGFGEDMELWNRIGNKNPGMYQVCSVSLGRHYPHTKMELKNQNKWYGRTIFKYLKVAYHQNKQDFLKQILYICYNIGMFLYPLFLIASFFILPLFSAILISMFLILIIIRYIRSPIKELSRIKFLVWYQFFSAFYFTIGLILSINNKQKNIGRDV